VSDEEDLLKLNVKTKISIQNLEVVRKSISDNNSKLIKPTSIDPTSLAKQIWQDVWSVSGATPEKCLYTFIELFIFKYLSDLDILDEDDKGNKINFKNIFALSDEKAFKNYSENVRTYLKVMFPESMEDKTTIINGTVLNPDVPEHSQVFYKILKKFNDFGEMKNIDPGFKSKVFEDFMKQSISKKNWGQFFTPRNIIDAMIEISDINRLPEGAHICDPACGVGGFILEPMKIKENGPNFYYKVTGNKIKPRFNFYGFDKGFEKEEQLTIILAKANMLIFLSELLKKNSTILDEFSKLFNTTFKLLSKTILGTLSKTEQDKYDLILTNPPYVTSGSSNYKKAIKKDGRLSEFYKVNAIGVEGLFLEWIIRSIKPSRKAFIVIPDGILNRLNDNKLRKFIKSECIIDGIISLPSNAFYTTPKKTYILAITKKDGKTEIERESDKQSDPVFSYLVSNIGETLDVKRFSTPDKNDLIEMVSLFNQFKGAKNSFKTPSLRCKIQPITKFNPDEHWSVDRWWSKDEKIELGIEEEDTIMTLAEFKQRVKDTSAKINELNKKLKGLK
jgi:type I restriction-modification system DNA methylase subunit